MQEIGKYLIFNNGLIFSKKSNRFIGYNQSDGYKKVRNPILGQHYIHRIVYTAFNGIIEDGLQIDHINCKKDDNRLINLRLSTSKQNQLNRGCNKNNKLQIKNIYEGRNTYHFVFKSNYLYSNKILEKVIEFRNNYLNNLIDKEFVRY